MKKSTQLIAILFIFLLTFGVSAADKDYWEDFIQTAEPTYEPWDGTISFEVIPMEWDQLEGVDNGLDTELHVDLGLFKNMSFYGYMYSHRDYLNVVGELKHRFLTLNKWQFAWLLRGYYLKGEFITPSVKLLSDTRLNQAMTLHNHVQLYFYENGVIGKHLDSGLDYDLNAKHHFKTRLKIFFVDSPLKSMYDFRITYNYVINEQTNYYLYTYFDQENVHLENVVEFKPIEPLTLTCNLVVNTGEWQNNYEAKKIVNDLRHWASIRAEYDLSEAWQLAAEYKKEAARDGYSYVKVGVNLSI